MATKYLTRLGCRLSISTVEKYSHTCPNIVYYTKEFCNLSRSSFQFQKYYSTQGIQENSKPDLGRIVELNLDDTDKVTQKTKNRKKKIATEESLEDEEIPQELKKDVKKAEKIVRNYEFIKLEKEDPILKKAMMRVKSKKERKINKEILLEGKRLIQDALEAGVEPVMIFFSQHTVLENLTIPEGVQLYKALYKEMQLWSDVETCQGIIGVFKEPNVAENKLDPNGIRLQIICDNVRDPGNMGSLLRIAASVGCQRVILTKGCVDLWESKVLRTASGCHFRVPIKYSVTWDEIPSLIEKNSKVYLADSNCATNTCKEDEVEEESTTYEIDGVEESTTYEIDEDGNKIQRNTKKSINFSKISQVNLPSTQYDYVNFENDSDVLLVIGGETQGLSPEAYDLAQKCNGQKIFIPLCGNVESLNSGVAASVISFEIRRQLKLKDKLYVDRDSVYVMKSGVGIYAD